MASLVFIVLFLCFGNNVLFFTKACNQYGVIRSTFCTVDHTTAFADLLNASAVVEEIVVDVSQCPNIPDAARLSVYFQDASDTQSPVLTYIQNQSNPISQHHLSISLEQPLYTNKIWIRSDNHFNVSCFAVYVLGCLTDGMCLDNNMCSHHGVCIGEQRCSCNSGYAGSTCNITVHDITVDDFNAVRNLHGVLETENSNFKVTGDVTTTRRRHHKIHFLGGHLTHTGQNRPGTTLETYPHSNSSYSVLDSMSDGFMFRVHATILSSHDDHMPFYFFTTQVNHKQPGAALWLQNGRLHFNVHFGAGNSSHLLVPFVLEPNKQYSIICSYSPSSGLSIYIDGVLVGSQAKFEHSHYTAGSMHPLCIGSCAAAGHNTNHNITLSRMLFVGASVQDLRRNHLLDLLGENNHALNKNQNQNFPDTCETTHPPHVTSNSANQTSGPTTSDQTSTIKVPSTTWQPQTTTLARTTTTLITAPSATAKTTTQSDTTTPQQTKTTTQSDTNTPQQTKTTTQSDTTTPQQTKTTTQSDTNTPQQTKTTTQSNPYTPAAVCRDKDQCAVLKTAGYSVCQDPDLAATLCQATCNMCTGG